MSTPITGLALTADGDLELSAGDRDLVWIGGVDAIAQMARCALQTIRGEMLLDADGGLDWQRVMGVGVTERQIEAEIRRVLGGVPGIATIASVDVAREGRLATVDWEAVADTGALIAGTVEI